MDSYEVALLFGLIISCFWLGWIVNDCTRNSEDTLNNENNFFMLPLSALVLVIIVITYYLILNFDAGISLWTLQ